MTKTLGNFFLSKHKIFSKPALRLRDQQLCLPLSVVVWEQACAQFVLHSCKSFRVGTVFDSGRDVWFCKLDVRGYIMATRGHLCLRLSFLMVYIDNQNEINSELQFGCVFCLI